MSRLNSSSCDHRIHMWQRKIIHDQFKRCFILLSLTRQKVVSYIYYGNVNSDAHKKRGHFERIFQNLKLLPLHYPDWVMRLYVNWTYPIPCSRTFVNLLATIQIWISVMQKIFLAILWKMHQNFSLETGDFFRHWIHKVLVEYKALH